MGHASRSSNKRGRVVARSAAKPRQRISRELSALIAGHELEIECSRCHARVPKSVAFLKAHREMSCPVCAAAILLDVSSIQGEVRRIEKSLRTLHSQLSSAMSDPKPGPGPKSDH